MDRSSRRKFRRLLALVGLLSAVLVLASCGGDSSQDATATPPTPNASDFPKPRRGDTLADMRSQLGDDTLVVAPSVSVLEAGERNRFGFGLFDASQRQIADAPMAVYFARKGGGEVQGPYPARFESLAVSPQFQSQSTASDPQSAQTLYVAEVPFRDPGRYDVLGIVALEDRMVAALPAQPGVEVVRDSPVPDVGEPAPEVSTPTVTSVGGAIEEIDTRLPPAPELHDSDFADVVGQQPAVLLFATPALCASRVCGPVADITLEVQAAHESEDIEFIHQEIYEENVVEEGFREQVREYELPTEPWLFTVDGDGEIAARLEGAFSADELEQAIDAATRG